MTVRAGVVTIDPHLPTSWGSLETRFRCLGRKVRLLITPEDVTVTADGPLRACLAGDGARAVSGLTSLGVPAAMHGEDPR